MKKGPLEYQMVTKTDLPSYICYRCDGSDSSDSSESNYSSESSDQKTFFPNIHFHNNKKKFHRRTFFTKTKFSQKNEQMNFFVLYKKTFSPKFFFSPNCDNFNMTTQKLKL